MAANGTEPVRCAIWARVSTTEQHHSNQTHELREWAQSRGLEVVREFATEDSAWAQPLKGAKGKAFDLARDELENGARLGQYTVVLIVALDRLSRRGIEDTLAALRRLTEHGCTVWSKRQSWVQELAGERVRDVYVSLEAWKSEGESSDKSDRIVAGMARVRREIDAQIAAGKVPDKTIGGRKVGAKDKRRRDFHGYEEAWKPGGALYEARQRKVAEGKAALLADPQRLREMGRDVACPDPPDGCGAVVGDACVITDGPNAGKRLRQTGGHAARQRASWIAAHPGEEPPAAAKTTAARGGGRKGGAAIALDVGQLRELRAAGCSYGEIAAKFGTSAKTIQRRVEGTGGAKRKENAATLAARTLLDALMKTLDGLGADDAEHVAGLMSEAVSGWYSARQTAPAQDGAEAG